MNLQFLNSHYIGQGAGANFDLFMANHIYVPILLGMAVIYVGVKALRWTAQR